MPREPLEDLQRRFYAMVASGASLDDADALVVSDDRARAAERLVLYRSMYTSRLYDALAADFPKLAAATGASEFSAIVDEYLRALPPVTRSVRDVGARLPMFLATRGERWRAELAALEWARVDVFDGPDASILDVARLAMIAPDRFPTLRLAWIPSSALVRVTFDVDGAWSALEDGAASVVPATLSSPRTILVWRRGSQVIQRTLDDDEAALSDSLSRGTTFAAVCATLTTHADPPRRAIELLLRWTAAEVLLAAS